MIAFHGKQEIKDEYLNRVKSHQIADEIVKGTYWEDGKGCAIGCTIHSSDLSAYETELGIPRILAKLEDRIFENLPNDLAMIWPQRFLDAITPGADLKLVWPRFAIWMMIDPKWGVAQFAKSDQSKKAIQDVANLYKIKLIGENISREAWSAAYADAADAADAATAAAYAAAADAADAATAAACAAAASVASAASVACAATAAAYAAACAAAASVACAATAAACAAAAADAAYAAAYAAAEVAHARIKWTIAQSEKLLELLREVRI
jgi:hypothetical protein